ncbi:MAG: putative nucleotidyltransferase [uncultured archaeon A07HN63]|nr:MAG: putative nucleotidyltransferase [uncultured archaeon A07HN63]
MEEIDEADSLAVDTDAIIEVLDDAPVTAAVLYGSHARGDATADSDVDLAVVFDDSLGSVETTRARLGLIERLTARLGTDDIDVVPLARTHATLRREIYDDGIVLYGSPDALPAMDDPSPAADQMAAFDELLTEIERVV